MPEDGAPPEFMSGGTKYADAEDQGGGDGRRSRQHRRQGPSDADQWCERLPGDRGTPNNADRGAAPFDFRDAPGVGAGGDRGAGGGGSKASRSNSSATMMGLGPDQRGGAGPGRFGGPGSGGPSSSPGAVTATSSVGEVVRHVPSGAREHAGAREREHAGAREHAAAREHAGSRAAQHGASAGTGGSEEWPSTQGRGARGLRDPPEYEEDNTTKAPWGPNDVPKRSKAGRQSGGIGPVALRGTGLGGPTRRSPEPIDPWQDSRHEAWRGEEMHAGLGGLPSIHNAFIAGPQGPGLGDGSRAASRLTAGTPTPREEDALDLASRQLGGGGDRGGGGGGGGGGRWGGGGVAAAGGGGGGAANASTGDWSGPGPADLGPAPPSPTASVARGRAGRDSRGSALHEVRSQQQDGAFNGLRRPDLSGVYHGH